MAAVSTYFKDFLSATLPTSAEDKACTGARDRLVAQLREYEDTREVIVDIFPHGSRRRSTAIRAVNDERSDVDLVAVTKLSESDHVPNEAIQRFRPFLERYYPGEQHRIQGRSLGIQVSPTSGAAPVPVDLVVASSPSEAIEGLFVPELAEKRAIDDLFEDWRRDGVEDDAGWLRKAQSILKTYRNRPLRIPDRDAQAWQDTHPLAQMAWTVEKNARTNGHYTGVVRTVKWWQRLHDGFEKPKGYTLEALCGDCCPDGITSVAHGVARTLTVISQVVGRALASGQAPTASDHGVGSNALARVSIDHFTRFHVHAARAAELANAALAADDVFESATLWGRLLGEKFPLPPPPKKVVSPTFSAPTSVAQPKPARFG